MNVFRIRPWIFTDVLKCGEGIVAPIPATQETSVWGARIDLIAVIERISVLQQNFNQNFQVVGPRHCVTELY